MTKPLSSLSRNSFWKRRCHFPSRTTWVCPQAGHWYGFADARECPMTAPRGLPAGGDFGLDMSLFLKELRCRTVMCPPMRPENGVTRDTLECCSLQIRESLYTQPLRAVY